MSSSRLYQTLPRTCLRQPIRPLNARSIARRRLLSTAPPAQKSRSWKSSAVRWGLAIGGVYYYNTSNLFAEEAAFPISQSIAEEEVLPTLDSLSKSKPSQPNTSQNTTAVDPLTPSPSLSPPATPLSETEEEAQQQGAYNEETGEINWDCPCLGGMAHGPCGEQFRTAFSCFIYSKEEPKGMDCIDHFKTMQTCFRDHPDIYGAELEPDDEEDSEPEPVEGGVPGDRAPEATPAHATARTSASPDETVSSSSPTPSSPQPSTSTDRAKAATEQARSTHEPQSESDDLVPKAAFDASGAPSSKGEK